MSERNTAVLQSIREKLDKYPELKSRQLHDMAIRLDSSLAAMSLRSFHARYVLPILRERSRAEGRVRPRRARKPATARKGRARSSGEAEAAPSRGANPPDVAAAASHEERARVRAIVLRLAQQVAAAESRADLVALIGGIDDVVTEIVTG